ncbi:CASP-like protein 1B1 [Cinnamomum micranthum f. kanehirae]|uniref:CASP-like protein n=1 Tax=Cinnamomum micranthum f. kanehirae TaxID=337451 RepID=A0A443P4W5_9MAGN|nr:CASP-like protein 1B1 [Cinnamomum micranthum f. kanehirae]
MAFEDGGKPSVDGMEKGEVVDGSCPIAKAKFPVWPFIMVLRVLAFCATVTATVVMALDKQTNTIVVATVGNTPIIGTFSAKFQQTPAFVFFVIANAIASLYNLSLLLVVGWFGEKLYTKGFGLLITVSDMVMVGLVASGAAGAAFMAELGKNGNSEARWTKICDKFDSFCDHAEDALIASFTGIGLLMALNVLSTIKLYRIPARS